MREQKIKNIIKEKIQTKTLLTDIEAKRFREYTLNLKWWSKKRKIDFDVPEKSGFKKGDLVSNKEWYYLKRYFSDDVKFKNVDYFDKLLKDTIDEGNIYGIILDDKTKIHYLRTFSQKELSQYIDNVDEFNSRNVVTIINIDYDDIVTIFLADEKRIKRLKRKWVKLWEPRL
ncbi:hypothetical protein [Marinitoga aeolica]|uniref:Uncharacterized protein n=1 Tax=Marinitoga aeolica TaxID=2809031 RepID=A0ABY8PRP9_9BACT|nr:hypothetical protein [Marinitoga aeolica]WGS65305.1 hypothetical protein JRV97_01755 [Marinitoga aeolica]